MGRRRGLHPASARVKSPSDGRKLDCSELVSDTHLQMRLQLLQLHGSEVGMSSLNRSTRRDNADDAVVSQ